MLKNYKWLLIYIICFLISWVLRYVLEVLGLIEPGFVLYSFDCYLSPLYFIGGIALFCFFKKMNITKSFIISLVKFFTPVCFGVYLIHNNMALAYFFFDGKFEFIAQFDPISLFISVIVLGIGIFVVCALIDWIRELLFRKLKVKERFGKFEENVYLKFDNYLNSNS